VTDPPPPTHATAPGDRRIPLLRRLAAAGAALLVAALLLRAPLPAYVQRPGPVFPLAGIVVVDGAAGPIRGDYLFTTVELVEADVLDALRAGFDPDAAVVTRAALLGRTSEADFVAEQAALFAEAEALAVRLGLEAAGSDLPPAAASVEAEGVGGPSAGLLIALAVADLASADDLAAGRRVAGTGAVEADGAVGPVGSVADKVRAAEGAGATVFLVPQAQLAQARAAATTVEVIGVTSVRDAVGALGGR
jgi:PDZ domain-containing protein